MERGEIFKNMQVLKDIEVKFVSVLGVCLLTSFWICLWFSYSSRSYCLFLKNKQKKPPADFTSAKPVLQVFQDHAGRGQLGSIIFLSRGSGKDGDSVWATVITGTQFPAHTLRALWRLHCLLCAFFSGQRQQSTSFCDLFISP